MTLGVVYVEWLVLCWLVPCGFQFSMMQILKSVSVRQNNVERPNFANGLVVSSGPLAFWSFGSL